MNGTTHVYERGPWQFCHVRRLAFPLNISFYLMQHTPLWRAKFWILRIKKTRTKIGTLRISHTSLKLLRDIPSGSFTESDLRKIGAIMYRSNRSFNMPPPGNPPGLWLFWKLLFKIPPTRAKMSLKCPTQGPFGWSNAPTQGTFQRHKNDRRTAETPSVVEQNLYEYNKNWETLLAYLLRTKVRAKRRTLLLQGHWMLSVSSSCNLQSVL